MGREKAGREWGVSIIHKLPDNILDSTIGNIKYRNNVVTGVIAVVNGNNTYDVYISSSDIAYPNIPTTLPEPNFEVEDAVEILIEYGNKEMPIIIGYAKKVVQNFVEDEINVLVTTLSAYTITHNSGYLEGRVEDIEGYENVIRRGFYYGTSTSYGSDTYSTGSFAAGSYNKQATGLTANTTYHYQAYVYDADDDIHTGDDKTMTTLQAPIVYLFSGDNGTDIISKHNGVSETVLDNWNSAGGDSIYGLTNDGTNLIELTDYGAKGKVHIHDGFSSGVNSSFYTPEVGPAGAAFDGTNLISCDWSTNLIYVHTGITSSVSSSFAAPESNISGLTVIGGNLISCDAVEGKIYIHDGISSGITSSFNAPEAYPAGLANDGTNLISGNYGTTGANKIYLHSGITSGVTTTLDAPAGYTDISALTYYST